MDIKGFNPNNCCAVFRAFVCSKPNHHDGNHKSPSGFGWNNGIYDIPGLKPGLVYLKDKEDLSEYDCE